MSKNAYFFVLALPIILALPLENAKASSRNARGEDPTQKKFERDSSYIRSWINTTFSTPVQGNSSIEKGCDHSQAEWTRNALRFKNRFPQFRNLGSKEPCTETREADLGNLDLRVNYTMSLDVEQLSRNGYTGLRFRYFYKYITRGAHCRMYSGTFIKSESQLYSVAQGSETRQNLLQIPTTAASRYYIDLRRGREFSYSLFKNISDINKVPGYKLALDAANRRLSADENRLQEVSPSNTAILLLPLLLSFLPLSLVQSPEDISRTRMFLYVFATDLLSSVPVLIKGTELLTMSSNIVSPLESMTFKTGNTKLQLVEIWITECSKTLPAFYIGLLFLFVGGWAMCVGCITEFIAWQYIREKPKMKFVTEQEVKRLLDDYAERRATISGLELAPLEAQGASLDVQRNRPSTMLAAASDRVGNNAPERCSIPDSDPRVLVFFFLGVLVIAVLLVHFLSLFYVEFKIFKMTKKREYLFTTGIMVCLLNIIFLVIYAVEIENSFWVTMATLLIFDIAVIVVLHRSTGKFFKKLTEGLSMGQVTTMNDERQTGARLYFVAGFALGAMTSLFSIFYSFCLPGIRGNERRENFFKYGCSLGSLHGLLIFENILTSFNDFFSLDSSSGYFIFLYNAFFVLILVLTETEILIQRSLH